MGTPLRRNTSHIASQVTASAQKVVNSIVVGGDALIHRAADNFKLTGKECSTLPDRWEMEELRDGTTRVTTLVLM